MTLELHVLSTFAEELVASVADEVGRGFAALVEEFRRDDRVRRAVRHDGVASVLQTDVSRELLRKQNGELVTSIDWSTEHSLRSSIGARYPDHAIIGEELEPTEGIEWTWVFDPLDGTTAMVQTALAEAFGVSLPEPAPAFGVMVGAIHEDRVKVGVVGRFRRVDGGLALADLWTGVAGRPTVVNGHPVPPLVVRDIGTATVAATAPEVMFSDPKSKAAFRAVTQRARATVRDQNCIGYMDLLSSRVDVVLERDLTLTDTAALVPILEGSGIRVSDHGGSELVFSSDAYGREYAVLAAAPSLHDEVLAIMRDSAREPALYATEETGPVTMFQGYAKKFRDD